MEHAQFSVMGQYSFKVCTNQVSEIAHVAEGGLSNTIVQLHLYRVINLMIFFNVLNSKV